MPQFFWPKNALAPRASTACPIFEDLVKVIAQVKPPIVVPMHCDGPHQAQYFDAFLDGRYPVRWNPDSRLVLIRKILPKATELFVLTPHPYAGRGRRSDWDAEY